MGRDLQDTMPDGWERRVARMITDSKSRCIAASIAAKRLSVPLDLLLRSLRDCPHFAVARITGGVSIRPTWGLRPPQELR